MVATAYPRSFPMERLAPVQLVATSIYRRRRVAAVLFGVVAVLLIMLAAQLVAGFVASPQATTVRAGAPAATGTVLVSEPAQYGASGAALPGHAVYVVHPGDTMWSIARAIAPDADVTEVAARLRELNGSSALQVGQRLRLN